MPPNDDPEPATRPSQRRASTSKAEDPGQPDAEASFATGEARPASTGPAAANSATAGPPAQAAQADQAARAVGTDVTAPLPPVEIEHYSTAQGGEYAKVEPACHNLIITVANLRANSKLFLNMRDDQWALWSAGGGLRGVNIRATKDPLLYLNSFLINAREMYLQTYADSTEMQINVYVYTPQSSLRGRVDLPPGASVTLETRSDRTSLIGLSSFDVEF